MNEASVKPYRKLTEGGMSALVEKEKKAKALVGILKKMGMNSDASFHIVRALAEQIRESGGDRTAAPTANDARDTLLVVSWLLGRNFALAADPMAEFGAMLMHLTDAMINGEFLRKESPVPA